MTRPVCYFQLQIHKDNKSKTKLSNPDKWRRIYRLISLTSHNIINYLRTAKGILGKCLSNVYSKVGKIKKDIKNIVNLSM